MKIPKQGHTAEFKTLVVQSVQGGQAAEAVATDRGLAEQSKRNSRKTAAADRRRRGRQWPARPASRSTRSTPLRRRTRTRNWSTGSCSRMPVAQHVTVPADAARISTSCTTPFSQAQQNPSPT